VPQAYKDSLIARGLKSARPQATIYPRGGSQILKLHLWNEDSLVDAPPALD